MTSRFPALQRSVQHGRLLRAAAFCLGLVLLVLALGRSPATEALEPPVGEPAAALPEGLTAAEWSQIEAQLAGTGQAASQPLQEKYLKASNVDGGDLFGYAVAIDGDLLVVGAPYEDGDGTSEANNDANNSGAVYVFERRISGWSQQAYLKASNVGRSDKFGASVAIAGDTVVVGAPFEAGDGLNQSDNSLVRSGAVYVFVRNSTYWSQQAYLKASNASASDFFGHAVSIDNDTIVVGAPNEDSKSQNEADNSARSAGAAYVFERNGSAWTQTAYLKASNADQFDLFGLSVAIAGDRIAVGAPQNGSIDEGAAFIYVRQGATWIQQARLTDHTHQCVRDFGHLVGFVGDGIEVSDVCPMSVHGFSFQPDLEVWRRARQWSWWGIGDPYYYTLHSMANDGDISLFAWENLEGFDFVVVAQRAYLQRPYPYAEWSDQFGYAVATSGGTHVASAPYEDGNGIDPADNSAENSGAVYVFEPHQIVPEEPPPDLPLARVETAYLKSDNPQIGDVFGSDVAVYGDVAVVTNYDEYAIVFERGESGWEFQQRLVITGAGPTEDSHSVAVDRDTIAVCSTYGTEGELSKNGVDIFVRDGPGWTWQAFLQASNVSLYDYFCTSVALSGDTLIVGASYEDGNGLDEADNSVGESGAAYVFVRDGTDWSQQAYLKASNVGSWDEFGFSVAVDGDVAIIGATGEDSAGSDPGDNSAQQAGAAYVFVREGTTWTQQAYLKAANVGAGDGFGYAVSLSGDLAVVGAWCEQGDGNDPADNSATCAGAAYVFRYDSSSGWQQTAYLKAANAEAFDQFGADVAVAWDMVAVAAPNEDGDGSDPANNSAQNAGAAYLFALVEDEWQQTGYLKASNAEADDGFGTARINSYPGAIDFDGWSVIVGADMEDGDGSDPADNSVSAAGAAYIFEPAYPTNGFSSVASEAELRDAITTINNAGPGSDWIDLEDDIDLTDDLPPLTNKDRKTTINGNGHTIDGGDDHSLIQVDEDVEVDLRNIHLTNGSNDKGGAVSNQGTLDIRDSRITNSTAEEGGGVWNGDTGTLTINGSTISGNEATAGSGGGIANYGLTTLVNVTLSGNTAAQAGGGFANLGSGQATLSNVTASDNRAGQTGGGGFAGLDSSTATFHRVLVAGNRFTGGAGGQEVYRAATATLAVNSHNLFGHSALTTAQALAGITAGGSDRTATSNGSHASGLATIMDPTLATNAGPFGSEVGLTPTHALVAGSPALDMAPNTACIGPPVNGLDQRLSVRNVDGDGTPGSADCDSGAYEFQPAGGISLVVANEVELRAALFAVNNAGAGTHTIDLAADILLNGDLTPFANPVGEIVINGHGHTIDGDDQYRLFQVMEGVHLTVNDLTLINGFGDLGGAISNRGTVNLFNCTISSSTAFEGAGIWNSYGATLYVSGSAIIGNMATGSFGGGITNYGAAELVNTTLSGNSAFDAGGGMANAGDGVATLHNVTFSDNEAGLTGGGGYAALHDSTSTFHQTLVSGNRYTGGANGQEVYREATATLAVNSHNLFGHSGLTTVEALAGLSPGGSDRTATSNGTQATALAAVLGTTLANNGGPTVTHALAAGSPAVDMAPDGTCAAAPVSGVDQRGEPRNLDGDGSPGITDCDSGAYEFRPAGGIVVSAGTEAELLAAILAVNSAGPGVHTIALTGDIVLTGDLPPFTNTQGQIVIQGNGHTIDGVDLYSLIVVESGVELIIHNLTLTNGLNDYGGAITNFGTILVFNSTISSSTALEGGGIWNAEGAHLYVEGSAIIGNVATDSHGGGIANYGTAELVNTTLSGNTAFAAGGGMANLGQSDATLYNVTFSDNDAGQTGGGGYAALDESTSTFHQTLLSGNRYTGGANGQELYRATTATLAVNSHNLFGHSGQTTAQALAGVTPGGTDRTATSNGTHPAALAAILAALADNGGPNPTHALLAGSPAVDSAPNAVCLAPPVDGVDQRGEIRSPDGDGAPGVTDCDSGAYEYRPAGGLAMAVGSEAELLAAMAAVNAAGPGVHTLVLTGDILLTGDLPPFTNTEGEIVIQGNHYTIDGDDLYSLIHVDQGVTLTIHDLTLTNGLNDYGGAITNFGTVNLFNSTISSSTALEGGAIWNAEGAELVVDSSAIIGNEATDSHGGAIANYGTAELVNTTLSGNTAHLAGGGFANLGGGQATFYNVTFSDNEAGQIGGGGFAGLDTSTAALHHTLLSGNRYTGGANGQELYRASTAAVAVNGYNLFGHSGKTTTQALAGVTPGGNDRTATSNGTHPAALATILEIALANNGGPTLTHALVSGSPALDMAPNAACFAAPVNGVDQRGEARGVNSHGPVTNMDSDTGAFEYQDGPVSEGICPVHEDVGYTMTTILGIGMGSPQRAKQAAKITIPDARDLEALYGQLAAKQFGQVRYVRFYFQGRKNYVQVKPPTSYGRSGAVTWWGAELDPAQLQKKNWIKGRWFLEQDAKKGKVPRALVMYPTYSTTAEYANVFETYDNTYTNFVAGTVGFPQRTTNILEIPETQGVTDIIVAVALVDINNDDRSIDLTLSAGGVSKTQTIVGPVNKKMELLNIVEVTLPNVPAGTSRVTIVMESELGEGDSAALLGATAHYACEP